MAKFVYRQRSQQEIEKRATQQGGMYDNMFNPKLPVFTPKGGDITVRYLPPTWENASHWGYDIYVHFGVGPDEQQYICPLKTRGQPCPVCEENAMVIKKGDEEYAKKLKPTRRVVAWVINRDDEKAGPHIWAQPWTVDRDVSAICIDKKTREILYIDDPENGYDVFMKREGAKERTQYIGFQIARRSSPLSDNPTKAEEWITFVLNNPIPDALIVYDYDHIKTVFEGRKKPGTADSPAEEAPRTRREQFGEPAPKSEDSSSAKEEAPPARVRAEEPPFREHADQPPARRAEPATPATVSSPSGRVRLDEKPSSPPAGGADGEEDEQRPAARTSLRARIQEAIKKG